MKTQLNRLKLFKRVSFAPSYTEIFGLPNEILSSGGKAGCLLFSPSEASEQLTGSSNLAEPDVWLALRLQTLC